MHGKFKTKAISAICATSILFAACSSEEAEIGASDGQNPNLSICGAPETEKTLLWGDLHVHTAYSLDALGFGTFATPADAYAFAAGAPLILDGNTVQLERPLDFAAVTDHAEWLDITYICGAPNLSNHPYCQTLRKLSSPETGRQVQQQFMFPTLLGKEPDGKTPVQSTLCNEGADACLIASQEQWARVQGMAHAANQPCEFTALLGYEWSATPGRSHSHRNIIFKNENVTKQAIDYIRYPRLAELFQQLELQCRPEDDCDVVAIPHNTNMGDGVSFDVEADSSDLLQHRAQYERLIEIHQEKGNSECLPPFGESDANDCDFETILWSKSRTKKPEDFSEEEWERMRSTYVRSLLLRGLEAYERKNSTGTEFGDDHSHPLQLGIVASTDTHVATPGLVSEEQWQGTAFSFGSFERAMHRVTFNPGGIVGVWAKENTRESIFSALKRRETYGTSGPRIELRFDASLNGAALSCDDDTADIVMGGKFSNSKASPIFRIRAVADKTPLGAIEIIRGSIQNYERMENVLELWSSEEGESEVCVTWADPDFDPKNPSFWYPRIKELPSKRWSSFQCARAGRCDEYPAAVQDVEERAWGSPIWYFPKRGTE